MKLTLRPARDDDVEFAFEMKRDAMGPYIIAKWGWDEDFQRGLHLKRWSEKPWSIIRLEEQDVGTVSLHWQESHLQFGEFYIRSSHRGKGLGSQVLRTALVEADSRRTETRLEFLKWNPVGSLYLRNGFRIVCESETHFFAARPAVQPNQSLQPNALLGRG